MAVNSQLTEYLRQLYGRSADPMAAMLPEESAPATSSAPSSIVVEDEGEPVVRPYSESGFAMRDEAAALEAERAAKAEQEAKAAAESASYLSAMRSAQRQDELAAMAARTMAPVEELARIQSRGLYRPSGVTPPVSAVSQFEDRQKAVQQMLAAQRGVKAEARQERAAEADIELTRVQQAREAARMEAEKLRLAMEQGEAPYKVMELQANVRKALTQAQLAEETAKAKGRPAVMVAREPKAPKAAPGERLRQLPTTTVEELSGFDPAIKTLTDLTNYYKTLDLSGFLSRQAAKLGESAPQKIQLYEAAAAPVRQAVGVILEKGKLAEGDISRYKQMMPKPGDSEAVVDKKLQTLTKVLNDIRASKVKELRGAGFQVGGEAPAEQPAAQANPVAPSKEDLARAAVAAFKRASESGATPEVLERLRNEAQAAIKAAGG